MKKVGYLYLVSLVILVCLLVSCGKQKETEPVISSGMYHVVMLDTKGNVWYVDGYEKLAKVKTEDGKAMSDIKQVSGGHHHTVILDNAGRVWAFGINSHGQLANGNLASSDMYSYPSAMLNKEGEQIKNIVQVVAGNTFTMLLDDKGYVWTVGRNDYGQLGHGDAAETYQHIPALMEDPKQEFQGNITQVTTGGLYSVLLDNRGQVWTVGRNDYGQLGNGDLTGSTQYHVSRMIDANGEPIQNIVQVAAGSSHTILLDKNGYVWGVGGSRIGELGLGIDGIDAHYYPILILDTGEGFQGNIAQIAAGFMHTVLLDNDGYVWASGSNTQGQLGFRNDSVDLMRRFQRMANKNWAPVGNIKQISAGFFHTLLLDNNNMVWIVGDTDLLVPFTLVDAPEKSFPVKLKQL